MSIALIGLIQNLDIRMNKFLYCYLTGVYTQASSREGNIDEETIKLSAKDINKYSIGLLYKCQFI